MSMILVSTFKINQHFNKPTECNFSEVLPKEIKIIIIIIIIIIVIIIIIIIIIKRLIGQKKVHLKILL